MKNHYMNKRCGIAILVILALAISPISAQTRRSKQKPQPQKKTAAPPPVAIVNNPSPEYRSGEVSVAVRGNENPIIRLGLAQNGVTLVEFPASDRFFAINPGSTDLVTIEDSPTKETDHFFVIRAGSGFLPATDNAKTPTPATSIIVQMSSGMVVTFLLYPVRDIERNAHRCVVTYDREAIINARRAAGLAINIDKDAEKADPKPPLASVRIAVPAETPPPPPASIAPPVKNEDEVKKEDSKSPPLLHDRSFPGRKEKWSKRLHGLKVAARTKVIDSNRHQALVAVRNTLSKPVTVVPGYPELYLHTLDDKGRVLQTDTLKRIKIECASPNGLIAPGETLRYLLTCEAPVKGVIDPDTQKLVKLEGEILGDDGGAGLRGKPRRVSSVWARALDRAAQAGVQIATSILNRGASSVIIATDPYGTIRSENSRSNGNRSFVEVPAGAVGFVMVTTLPEVDEAGSHPAEGNERKNEFSDQELAELMTSADPARIRAALPRMAPELRRIAQMALKEIEAAGK